MPSWELRTRLSLFQGWGCGGQDIRLWSKAASSTVDRLTAPVSRVLRDCDRACAPREPRFSVPLPAAEPRLLFAQPQIHDPWELSKNYNFLPIPKGRKPLVSYLRWECCHRAGTPWRAGLTIRVTRWVGLPFWRSSVWESPQDCPVAMMDASGPTTHILTGQDCRCRPEGEKGHDQS